MNEELVSAMRGAIRGDLAPQGQNEAYTPAGTALSGRGVEWLREKYEEGDLKTRAAKAFVEAQPRLKQAGGAIKEQFNKTYGGGGEKGVSWLMDGMRYVAPRVMSPWIDWDAEKRKQLMEEFKERYDVPYADQKKFIDTGELPQAIEEGERLKKEQEDTAVEAAGGKLVMLGKHIVNNPGQFAADLARGIAADPELLGLPLVYKGAFAASLKSMGRATTAAQRGQNVRAAHIGGITAEGAAGGAIVAGGEAMSSLQQEGAVDPERVKMGWVLGAGGGILMGTAQSITKAIGRAGKIAEAKVSIKSEEVQAAIYQHAEKNKVSLDVAVTRVMERYGIDPTEMADDIRVIVEQLKKEMPDPASMGRMKEGTGGYNRNILQGTPESGFTGATERVSTQGSTIGMRGKMAASMEAQGAKEQLQPQIDRIGTKETLASIGGSLASDIERIAWKERSAAAGAATREISPAEELFTTSAFVPQKGTVTAPVMTLKEFADSSMGKSSSGNPLSGAVLNAKWMKYHKDLVEANKDPNMRVTLKELEEIMSEKSPAMRKLFMDSGRKAGTRASQIPKKFRQEGKVDPKFLTTLAGAAGMAALIGYGYQNNPNDAVKYAVAAGLTLAFGGKILNGISSKWPATKYIVQAKRNVKIDDLANKFQGEGAVYERVLRQRYETMRTISGQKGIHNVKANRAARKLRQDVTHALEDKTGKLYRALPDNGKELFKYAKKTFADAAEWGTKKGILNDTLEYYVPHIWQHATKSAEEMMQELFGTQTRKTAMDTIHKQRRVIPTYSFGKTKDLQPRTTDIAELVTIYMKSLDQASRSKDLFNALKKTKSPIDNKPIVMYYNKAPSSYKAVNHPKFNAYKAHPDIAPALRAMFGSTDFSAMVRGVLGVNFLLKRQAVSISGFHAKALLFSHLMAGGLYKFLRHPIKGPADTMRLFKGKSPALRAFMEQADTPLSKEIDRGLRNGLVLNIVDDVGKDTFYEFMEDMSGIAQRSYEKNKNIISGKTQSNIGQKAMATTKLPFAVAGKYTVKGLEGMNRFVDSIMWDRIYTGLKLQTYLNKMESLSAKYGHTTHVDELSKMAAEFTNDAFGGINWLRIAQNVENKVGSDLALLFASRGGRAFAQASMFAPDWTTSQIRIFYKAFANKNPIQREMYQGYQFTGMLMFVIGADAVNMAMSGKHLWENKDPSTINIGNGRRLSLSKQYYEPAKWIWKPGQSALNKTSTIIRTMGELGMGQKYLRSGGMAEPIESNIMHVLGKTMPIWMSNGVSYGMGAGTASMAGFPVYGQPSVASGGGRGSGGGRSGGRASGR